MGVALVEGPGVKERIEEAREDATGAADDVVVVHNSPLRGGDESRGNNGDGGDEEGGEERERDEGRPSENSSRENETPGMPPFAVTVPDVGMKRGTIAIGVGGALRKRVVGAIVE